METEKELIIFQFLGEKDTFLAEKKTYSFFIASNLIQFY